MQYPVECYFRSRYKYDCASKCRENTRGETYLARCRRPDLSCTSDKINTSTGTRRATLCTTIGTPRPRSSVPSASGTERCSGESSPTLRTNCNHLRYATSTRCRRPIR